MLISPPFLPDRRADESDAAFVACAMAGDEPGRGAWPVSFNLGWHGGLHLTAPSDASGRSPVRAIADGVIKFASPLPLKTSTDDRDDPQTIWRPAAHVCSAEIEDGIREQRVGPRAVSPLYLCNGPPRILYSVCRCWNPDSQPCESCVRLERRLQASSPAPAADQLNETAPGARSAAAPGWRGPAPPGRQASCRSVPQRAGATDGSPGPRNSPSGAAAPSLPPSRCLRQ